MTVRGRHRLQIDIPLDLKERLECAASERQVSTNWLARAALEDFLERLIPVDEMRLTRDRPVA